MFEMISDSVRRHPFKFLLGIAVNAGGLLALLMHA